MPYWIMFSFLLYLSYFLHYRSVDSGKFDQVLDQTKEKLLAKS